MFIRHFPAIGAACLIALPVIGLGSAEAQSSVSNEAQTKLVKGASVAIEGCVTAGQKADTYVLGTVKEIPGQPIETGKRRVYWVSRKHLRDHVGHIVQLSGRIEKLETHELEVKTTADGVIVEIEGNGRQVKTTPATLPVPTTGAKEADIPTTVIRLNVDKVTMKGSC